MSEGIARKQPLPKPTRDCDDVTNEEISRLMEPVVRGLLEVPPTGRSSRLN
jgi:hypothetical protein